MRFAVVFLALFCAPLSHAAFVTFEYTGAAYDTVIDGTGDPTFVNNPWLTRTQDFVSGWLTIDTDKVPGGLANASVYAYPFDFSGSEPCTTPGCSGTAIHDFGFFDGVTATSVLDPFYEWNAYMEFDISFDAYGNFASWAIVLSGDPAMLSLSNRGDVRTQSTCGEQMETGDSYLCASSSAAGTWKKVPEPGAWVLLAAGLAASWVVRKRTTGARRIHRPMAAGSAIR